MTRIEHEGAFHRLTIAPIIVALGNLDALLTKAEAHLAAIGVDPDVLLQARLYPDMFSLIQQLQYALFLPAEFARHFAASAPPRVGYDEASFADVHAGIAKATQYLEGVDARVMDERAGMVVPTFMDPARGQPAESYASAVIMPDFYFHLTVAYAILRHNGVPLGKSDFLGSLATVPVS